MLPTPPNAWVIDSVGRRCMLALTRPIGLVASTRVKKEKTIMRVAKNNVDVKMEIPSAVIRQKTDFGDANANCRPRWFIESGHC